MEGHSSRLEQAAHRISELNEMVIKGKIEELLARQLKTYERNMKEFTNFIKRPNLRIMDIEEEEEKAGVAAPAQQPWSGKICKSGGGRKTPQETGEGSLPM
jgi:hypothetical protein